MLTTVHLRERYHSEKRLHKWLIARTDVSKCGCSGLHIQLELLTRSIKNVTYNQFNIVYIYL